MPSLQNIDVQVFLKGETPTVTVSGSLIANGWLGGQFVDFVASAPGSSPLIRTVDVSDGTQIAGFLLRASENKPNSEYNYTSYQPSVTRAVTIISDGGFYLFRSYERFEFPNRTSGTPLIYTLGAKLSVSERGLLTTPADASAAGIATPLIVGPTWAIPNSDNELRLGIDYRAP